MRALRRLFTLPLRLYRNYLSPLKGSPCCRFEPSCSAYAIEAIEEWGILVGCALSLWRVLRCNPFGKGGYDPVPRRKRRKQNSFGKGASAGAGAERKTDEHH